MAGAKREGEVTDYTSTNHQMSGPLVKLFEKKYPFIRVNLVTHRRQSRSFKERRPKPGRGSMPWTLSEPANWESSHLSIAASSQNMPRPCAKTFVRDSRTKTAYGRFNMRPYSSPPTTRNWLKPNEVPKSWDDFLDPKWKGKLSLDTEAFEWMGFLLTYMGEQRALRYFDRLSQTGRQISQRPLSSTAASRSRRIPYHDGFKCQSHSRS